MSPKSMFCFCEEGKCGWGGNADDCGEQCHEGVFTEEKHFCNKGEICCPKPPQGEECSTSCGPFDAKGKWTILLADTQKNWLIKMCPLLPIKDVLWSAFLIFYSHAICNKGDYGKCDATDPFSCCPISDTSCSVKCKNGACRLRDSILAKYSKARKSKLKSKNRLIIVVINYIVSQAISSLVVNIL